MQNSKEDHKGDEAAATVAKKRQRHAHDGRETHHHRDIDARVDENERGKRARKDPYQIIAFKIVV